MNEIDKIFKDVFNDIKFNNSKKVNANKKSKLNDAEYINEVFSRLEYFYKIYGKDVVNDKSIDRTIEMLLFEKNFALEETNIECKCGALIKVKYIVSLDNKMSICGDDFYDYGNMHLRDSRYILKCSLCGTSVVVISFYNIIGVIKILISKGFEV